MEGPGGGRSQEEEPEGASRPEAPSVASLSASTALLHASLRRLGFHEAADALLREASQATPGAMDGAGAAGTAEGATGGRDRGRQRHATARVVPAPEGTDQSAEGSAAAVSPLEGRDRERVRLGVRELVLLTPDAFVRGVAPMALLDALTAAVRAAMLPVAADNSNHKGGEAHADGFSATGSALSPLSPAAAYVRYAICHSLFCEAVGRELALALLGVDLEVADTADLDSLGAVVTACRTLACTLLPRSEVTGAAGNGNKAAPQAGAAAQSPLVALVLQRASTALCRVAALASTRTSAKTAAKAVGSKAAPVAAVAAAAGATAPKAVTTYIRQTLRAFRCELLALLLATALPPDAAVAVAEELAAADLADGNNAGRRTRRANAAVRCVIDLAFGTGVTGDGAASLLPATATEVADTNAPHRLGRSATWAGTPPVHHHQQQQRRASEQPHASHQPRRGQHHFGSSGRRKRSAARSHLHLDSGAANVASHPRLPTHGALLFDCAQAPAGDVLPFRSREESAEHTSSSSSVAAAAPTPGAPTTAPPPPVLRRPSDRPAPTQALPHVPLPAATGATSLPPHGAAASAASAAATAAAEAARVVADRVPFEPTASALSPCGTVLAVGTALGQLWVIRLDGASHQAHRPPAGQPQQQQQQKGQQCPTLLESHRGAVIAVAFHPTEPHLLLTTDSRVARVYDLRLRPHAQNGADHSTTEGEGEAREPEAEQRTLVPLAPARWYGGHSDDILALTWLELSPSAAASFKANAGPPSMPDTTEGLSQAHQPQGHAVGANGGRRATLRAVSHEAHARTARFPFNLRGPSVAASNRAAKAAPLQFITAAADKFMLRWDAESGAVLQRFNVPRVFGLAFSPCTGTILTVDSDSRLSFYDASCGDDFLFSSGPRVQLQTAQPQTEPAPGLPDAPLLPLRWRKPADDDEHHGNGAGGSPRHRDGSTFLPGGAAAAAGGGGSRFVEPTLEAHGFIDEETGMQRGRHSNRRAVAGGGDGSATPFQYGSRAEMDFNDGPGLLPIDANTTLANGTDAGVDLTSVVVCPASFAPFFSQSGISSDDDDDDGTEMSGSHGPSAAARNGRGGGQQGQGHRGSRPGTTGLQPSSGTRRRRFGEWGSASDAFLGNRGAGRFALVGGTSRTHRVIAGEGRQREAGRIVEGGYVVFLVDVRYGLLLRRFFFGHFTPRPVAALMRRVLPRERARGRIVDTADFYDDGEGADGVEAADRGLESTRGLDAVGGRPYNDSERELRFSVVPAFVGDRCVAMGTVDNTVRIFDAFTGKLRRTLHPCDTGCGGGGRSASAAAGLERGNEGRNSGGRGSAGAADTAAAAASGGVRSLDPYSTTDSLFSSSHSSSEGTTSDGSGAESEEAATSATAVAGSSDLDPATVERLEAHGTLERRVFEAVMDCVRRTLRAVPPLTQREFAQLAVMSSSAVGDTTSVTPASAFQNAAGGNGVSFTATATLGTSTGGGVSFPTADAWGAGPLPGRRTLYGTVNFTLAVDGFPHGRLAMADRGPGEAVPRGSSGAKRQRRRGRQSASEPSGEVVPASDLPAIRFVTIHDSGRVFSWS